MSDGSKYIPTILVGRVLTTRAYFLLKAGQFTQAFKRGDLPNVLFPAFQFKSFLDLAPMEFSQRLFTQTAPCVDLSYAEVAGRDEWVVSLFFQSPSSPKQATWDFDQDCHIKFLRS
jgi:hypothetical protein